MNTDQIIEGLGKAVSAAQPAQEYCFLGFWGVTWWPLCMTKSEWSGWAQVIGSLLAIGAAFLVLNLQLRAERIKNRQSAAAILSAFTGLLHTFEKALKPEGGRDRWPILQLRVMLEAEMARTDSIQLHALSFNEQQGVFLYRMAALEMLEALRVAESDAASGETKALVSEAAYDFVLAVIQSTNRKTNKGRELLGDWVRDM